ncbi:hypothetical protein BKA65DRAFT_106587 [Rhexocercosporidium sp. MPI-PUGE-AT-0058]|nr:hypothetical protein BKA65DRAFT_106587 [Rhexocercosporidium sp. MPI-PUGE-AT-0058]
MYLKATTTLTLSFLTLLPIAKGCVNTFTKVQSNLMEGFIQDNGIQVCTATNKGRGLDNHFWFDCIRGFAAWTDDGRLVAYAHDGVDYRMRPQSCAEDLIRNEKVILCAGAAYC